MCLRRPTVSAQTVRSMAPTVRSHRLKIWPVRSSMNCSCCVRPIPSPRHFSCSTTTIFAVNSAGIQTKRISRTTNSLVVRFYFIKNFISVFVWYILVDLISHLEFRKKIESTLQTPLYLSCEVEIFAAYVISGLQLLQLSIWCLGSMRAKQQELKAVPKNN